MLIIINSDDLKNELTMPCTISGCFDSTEQAHREMHRTLQVLKAKPAGNIAFSTYTADDGKTYQSAKLNARIEL